MNWFKSFLLALLPEDSGVCVICDRKIKGDFFVKSGHAGICSDCADQLAFTRQGSSFPAVEPLSYLLCPFEYSGSIEKLLRSFKFGSNFKNGEILNILLRNFFEGYPHLREFDCVIPVPLSAERLNERGYNQSEIIARSIAEVIGIPLNTDTLVRIRHTERQSSLSAAERILNVKNAFLSKRRMDHQHILLVDDIYTTGSTMKNCAEALKDAGAAEIAGIAAATTIHPERPILL